jgi:hypothetical protein
VRPWDIGRLFPSPPLPLWERVDRMPERPTWRRGRAAAGREVIQSLTHQKLAGCPLSVRVASAGKEVLMG